MYLSTRDEAISQFLVLQEKLDDVDNSFFRDNKIFPWVRVAAYRAKKIECPENEELVKRDDCWTGPLEKDFDIEDFDGVPFKYVGSPKVQLKTIDFSQAGNRKDVKIADPETGEILWRENLMKEVFCRGWLLHPTLFLTVDVNFLNMQTGIFMDAKIAF